MFAASLERLSKFSLAYSLYLAIVWLFDYVYYPWLAIKFRHLVFLPLFGSIFLVSWGGYYLYEYFQEDVFFVGKINLWLERTSGGGVGGKLKSLILTKPGWVFAAIATWWSPLHAYVFFRRGEPFELSSFTKTLAKGSFFCAAFWGIVAESIILLWGLVRIIAHGRLLAW